MNTLTLGFVGGCLTHQAGIPHPRLFHRVAGRRIEDERGVRLRLVLSKDYAADPRLRVTRLVQDERPDVLLLHRSMNVFLAKAMAVFVADGGRYVVNPFLFRRSGSRSWIDHERERFRGCLAVWPPGRMSAGGVGHPESVAEIDARPPEIAPARLARADAVTAARGFRLGDLTWIAGEWLGLDDWAIDDELRIVREAREACDAAGVPLLVLGPGLRIGVQRSRGLAARLDAALDRWATATGTVGHVSLLAALPETRSPHPLGVEHYRDHGHLNIAGHEHVAARLAPHLDRLCDGLQERHQGRSGSR